MKTIGIIGSRRRDTIDDFKDCEKIFLEIYEDGDEIISGGCPKGGDKFAEMLAKKHQVTIKIYYAQWNKLGKGAGFARNTYIANSDVLISVCSEDRKGGAEDTIRKFLKKHTEDDLYLVPPQPKQDPSDFDPLDL